jgi:hypothetical protein
MGTLLSMKPNHLLTKHFYLAGNPKFQPSLAAAAGLANTETILSANTQTSVDLDAFNNIQCAPNGQKAYAFLPWRPGGVTYMEIPVGCQLVMTGPLSACNIWAFESNGTTVLVHANANAGVAWADMTGAQKLANMATKQNAITAIKNQYANVVDVAGLVYAATPLAPNATTYEGYMGFVIGCRPRNGYSFNKHKWTKSAGSNTWTFYFYGFNGAGATDRVLLPM